MPIRVYRCAHGTVQEFVQMHGEDYPPSMHCRCCGESARNVPGAPALDFHSQSYREMAAQGHTVREAGMDKDARRARESRREKKRKAYAEIVGRSVHEWSQTRDGAAVRPD